MVVLTVCMRACRLLSVLNLLALLGLCTLTVPTYAADNSARIYPQEIKLGEAVTLTLKGETAVKQFDHLDLSALQQQFAIGEVDGESDRLRVRLYPLKTGEAVLKRQVRPGLVIPETHIRIQPNPDVEIEWQQPSEQLFAGQNAYWRAKVSVERANPVWFEPPRSETLSEQWQVHTLEEPVEVSVFEAHKTAWLMSGYRYRAAWNERSGDGSYSDLLPSPVLVVKHPGGRPWRFYHPPQQVRVAPLPGFLPFNVVIGQVEALATPLPIWLTDGEIGHWTWHLSTRDMDVEGLKRLADQLVAQLDANPKVSWLTESESIKVTWHKEGVQGRLKVQIPYRVIRSGWLTTPEMALRVFDPQSGKLKVTVVKSQGRLIVPVWLDWGVKWLLMTAVLAGGFALLWLLQQAFRRWRLRRAVAAAPSWPDLIRAMQAWQGTPLDDAEAVGEQAVFSLARFERRYRHRYGESVALKQLIESINRGCYAPDGLDETEFRDTKRQAVEWIKRIPWRPRLDLLKAGRAIFSGSEKSRKTV